MAPQPSAEERPARAEFVVCDMPGITTVSALEDLLGRQPGVERAQVNAATERVTVDYVPGLVSPERLARAMERAGYRIEVVTADEETIDADAVEEIGQLRRRGVGAARNLLPTGTPERVVTGAGSLRQAWIVPREAGERVRARESGTSNGSDTFAD